MMRTIPLYLLAALVCAACDKPADPPAQAAAPAAEPTPAAEAPAAKVEAPAAPAAAAPPAGAALHGVYVRKHKVPPMQDGPDEDARDCLKLEAGEADALRFTVVSVQPRGMSCGFNGVAAPDGEGVWSFTSSASGPAGTCSFKLKRTAEGIELEGADDAACAGHGCGMNASINGVSFKLSERAAGEDCAL